MRKDNIPATRLHGADILTLLLPLCQGEPGQKGELGETGPRGLPGMIGPPGMRGPPVSDLHSNVMLSKWLLLQVLLWLMLQASFCDARYQSALFFSFLTL